MSSPSPSVGAIFALKRKKMLEKEVAKLEGQMVLLEQQRLMIQSKCPTNPDLLIPGFPTTDPSL